MSCCALARTIYKYEILSSYNCHAIYEMRNGGGGGVVVIERVESCLDKQFSKTIIDYIETNLCNKNCNDCFVIFYSKINVLTCDIELVES